MDNPRGGWWVALFQFQGFPSRKPTRSMETIIPRRAERERESGEGRCLERMSLNIFTNEEGPAPKLKTVQQKHNFRLKEGITKEMT
jgi:hypothetical protein